jgi:hypothetical protein
MVGVRQVPGTAVARATRIEIARILVESPRIDHHRRIDVTLEGLLGYGCP